MTSPTFSGTPSTSRIWQSNCRELAEWSWERLAVKRDRHGLYSAEGGASWSFSALTMDDLAAHFAGEVTLGCGVISAEDQCLWIGWDLDNHNNALAEDTNLNYAVVLKERLSEMGFQAIIEDSDGRGGIHVWLLFSEAIDAGTAFRFARHVARDFHQHVPAVECFPKARTSKTAKGCGGGYLRLPGKHHKRDHWSRFWSQGTWLEALGGISLLLASAGNDPSLIVLPEENVSPPVTTDWRSDDAVVERARKYLTAVPGAVSGSGGHPATFHAACLLMKGFELSSDQAFDVLSEWNATCDPPWSEHELRHKIESASRASGKAGYLRNAKPERWDSIVVPKHLEKRESAKQEEPRLITVKASEVTPKELDWLWDSRFLIGNVNIVGGDPGLGKSMILIDIAARASTGRNWPDGSPCQKCSVLYSTTEDGIEDTVVPRLIAAGAELENVEIVQGVIARDRSELPLLLNDHMAFLDQKLTENPQIKVLIIDTLQSHIGSTISTNNNSSVRGVMTPLKRLAEKHHVAVICIEHLTKSKTATGENATYRIQGSIAFAGAARSVWIVAKDQGDESGKRRFLQASKTNLAPDNSGLGLAYEICGPTGKPYIHWLETNVSTPIDQLLQIPDATKSDKTVASKLSQCCDWLRETLTEPTLVSEIEAAAEAEMFSKRTLHRAKAELSIKSDKPAGVWYWTPPDEWQRAKTEMLIEVAESLFQ